MHVQSLQLENIQSYEQETITFDTGEVLIHGSNGAGKSTIFRSIYGALYPKSAKHRLGANFLLENFVRTGCDAGRITLTIVVGGDEYTISWEISSDGTTESCTATSPALSDPVTGVTAVEEFVAEELLEMDASSFISSVYVQQGDIARLVEATGSERQEILDGLLGLRAVDEMIERVKKTRVVPKRKRDNADAQISEVTDQLSDYRPSGELIKLRDQRQKAIEQIDQSLAAQREERDAAKESLTEAQNKLEEVKDLRERRDTLAEKVATKQDTLDEHKQELTRVREQQENLEGQIESQENRIQALDADTEVDVSSADVAEEASEAVNEALHTCETDLQTVRKDQETIQNKIEDYNGRIDNHETKIEKLTDQVKETEAERDSVQRSKEAKENELAGVQQQVEQLTEEIAALAAEVDINEWESVETLRDDQIPATEQALREQKEDCTSQKAQLRSEREQLERLEETGECPVCGTVHDGGTIAGGTDIDDAKVKTEDAIETLEQEQETIEAKLETLGELKSTIRRLQEKRRTKEQIEREVEQYAEKITSLSDTIDEHNQRKQTQVEEVEKLSEKKADLQEKAESVAKKREELENRREQLQQRRDIVQEAVNTHEAREEARDEYSELEKREDHLLELIEEVEQTVTERKRELKEVKRKLAEAEVEELKQTVQTARNRVEECKAEIESLEAKKNKRQEEEAKIQSRLESREQLEDRKETLEKQKQWYETVVADLNAVIETYEQSKTELREENVKLLNYFTNQVFSDLYQQRSYARLEIEQDYTIRIVQSDGTRIKPEVASGGETTVINLALRAGVYRVIAERAGGQGVQLPPLILDEPTTYLDESHVGELQAMLDSIAQWNVPQVLVVSHDGQLIDAGDSVLHVTKDDQTNASTVQQATTAIQAD